MTKWLFSHPLRAVDVIVIKHQPYNAYDELQRFEQTLNKKKIGACCNFIGTMRDFNQGDDVSEMFLQHYQGMTENYLQKLEAQCKKEFLVEVLIIHRVGAILPSDTIVLTAAWSAHRKQAFEACRYLIEELKHHAPFWKKETLTNGTSRWVESNTPA